MRSWPAYGELSRQRIDDMEAAQDADPRGKRDPRDFALWKGRKPGEPASASWPTPWGRGRPGWHLECSAMVGKYLGDEFDIHGGGLDLRFPHHENELAQSRAAGRPFARLWMHNAMLNLDGEKMSKSVGNTLLVERGGQAGPAGRAALLPRARRTTARSSSSPRRRSPRRTPRSGGSRDSSAGRTEVVGDDRPAACSLPPSSSRRWTTTCPTPAALAVLQDAIREGNRQLDAATSDGLRGRRSASVRAMLDVLGLDPLAPPWASAGGRLRPARCGRRSSSQVALEQRAERRAAQDFAAADAIRDQLKAAGVLVEDTPDGPRWTDGSRRRWQATAPRRGAAASPARTKGARSAPAASGAGAEGQGSDAQGRPSDTSHAAARRARPRAGGQQAQGHATPPVEPATRGDRGVRTSRGVAGRNAVIEALRAGVPVIALYVAERVDADDRIREAVQLAADGASRCSRRRAASSTGCRRRRLHQGIVLQVPAYEYADPDDFLVVSPGAPPLVIALDGVTDPRNLGAVIRSAAAFGAHGVVFPTRRAAGMTATAWKASAGAAARVPSGSGEQPHPRARVLRDAGFFVVGLDAGGSTEVADLDVSEGPLVLVVGAEGKGLSRLVRETCDVLASIPMAASIESLNAGVAAGIALYEIARVRRKG